MMISAAGWDCARTLSIASARKCAWLYVVMTTLTEGRECRPPFAPSCIVDCGIAVLELVHFRKQPVDFDQLSERPALADEAVVEHDDLVGAFDGGQAMRDHDHGPAFAELVQCFLDQLLGNAVERVG